MEKQKKRISLRLKLIGIIIPIVLFIIVTFFILARDMVLKISKEELLADSRVYSEKIGAWTGQIFSELEVYQNTIEEDNFENDKEILKYLESTVDKSEAYPVGLYMGDDSGVYLDGSGWIPGSDWVLEEREWYVDGKDNETFAFGEPYYDSMTGAVCVSASVLVDYSPAVRVLATDVYLDYVAGIISDMSNQGDEEAFLVTQNTNTIIAHPNTDMLAVTLDAEGYDSLYANIGAAIKAEKAGIIQVKGDNGEYYVSLHKIDNTDWYLVTYVTEQKMLADLYQMEVYMVIIALVAAVILIAAMLRVTGRIVKPVQKVTGVIGEIAKGDFTQNLAVSGHDEIAVMSNNMQMFISQMRNTITEISTTADWLNKQSVENENASESLMDSSRNQARSMELLNRLAEELAREAEEVAGQMDTLADMIKRTHEDGNTARELMKESVVMSQNGRDDMEHINSGMESISRSIDMLSSQIARVGAEMTQIGNMVDMIIDISDETNLLSLNASIEAARAGDAGRGFAVVAEQIGKLAANSSAAADSISRLTAEIGNIVEEATLHMDTSVAEVEKSVGIVAEARTTFIGLYGKVEETSRHVEQMIELVGSVDDVASRMEQITENQHRAAMQIVESAKEMNDNTENVTLNSKIVEEAAQALKKESINLMDKVSQFKI